MRILISIRYYLPGYKSGGPVRSLSNLVSTISGHDYFVICSDRDLMDPLPYSSVTQNSWNKYPNHSVFYVKKSLSALIYIWSIGSRSKPDLIYVNSFFDVYFSLPLYLLSRIKKIPILVAPRGEFSSGALSLGARKKYAYFVFLRFSGLLKNAKFHATSIEERNDIRRLPLSNNIFLCQNLPNVLDSKIIYSNKIKNRGFLKIVMPARIARVKNTLFSLKLVSELGDGVTLDLYGIIEDEPYWRECEEFIKTNNITSKIIHHGPIEHQILLSSLGNYDVFLLPTLGENFGHSILESLSLGIPVLISDKTPWNDLFEYGVGAAIALSDPQSYVSYLRGLKELNEIQYRNLRSRCLDYYKKKSFSKNIIEEYSRMFKLSVLGNNTNDR